MKTKFGNGDSITATAPAGGVTSGLGVLLGAALFGIAATTAAEGEAFAMDVTGEFDHVKEGAGSGQAWAVGDNVYWDNTNKRLTKTASGNTLVGVATAAATTTATEGRFLIK